MTRRRLNLPRYCGNGRAGLTKVDVLVLLGAVLLVGIVVAPGILMQSRTSPHKLRCMNSLRNVGLAMQNFASANDDNLPEFVTSQPVTNSAGQQGEMVVGWPIQLLPALDNTALLKSIRQNAVIRSGRAEIGEKEQQVSLLVFQCVGNDDSYRTPGRLSFVVNAGFISRDLYHGDPGGLHKPGTLTWTGPPGSASARAVHMATGVIWQSIDDFRLSWDDIAKGDGTSTTIFLTENLQAGNWYETDTVRIGFGFPVDHKAGQVPFGRGHIFESEKKPLNTMFDGGALVTASPSDWTINADPKAKVGTRPRPSSNHEGGVNVVFCDGATKFLNENIDPHVYLKLMTSNAMAYGETELLQSQY